MKRKLFGITIVGVCSLIFCQSAFASKQCICVCEFSGGGSKTVVITGVSSSQECEAKETFDCHDRDDVSRRGTFEECRYSEPVDKLEEIYLELMGLLEE